MPDRRRNARLWLHGLAAALAGSLLGACTSAHAPDAPYHVDRSNRAELGRQASVALLRAVDLPGWTEAPSEGVDVVGLRILQACGAHLSADLHIAVEKNVRWRRGTPRPVLDQSVYGLDQPLGPTAVDDASAALTCSTYQSAIRNEDTVDRVRPFDTPPAPPGARTFGYCERGSVTHATRCVLLVGAGNLVCSVNAASDSETDARKTIVDLNPTVVRLCVGAATMTPSPSSTATASPAAT